jgi:hypothetical protein
MVGYIYLIRVREFINTNEDIYKIGRTDQEPNSRMLGYPKGSEVILYKQVEDSITMEGIILKMMNNNFEKKPEIGSEYFRGNKHNMVLEIEKIINIYNITSNKHTSTHISTHNPIIQTKIETNKIKCIYCEKLFSRNIKQHYNTCKKKDTFEYEEKYTLLLDQLAQSKEQIKKLEQDNIRLKLTNDEYSKILSK